MFKRKPKKSFFEKLTGSVHLDDDFDNLDDDFGTESEDREMSESRDGLRAGKGGRIDNMMASDEDEDSLLESVEHEGGQLGVDVLQTDDSIIIKAMIAGVKPNDIDVDISRDMVTIKGSREESEEISDENYYHRELYWGSFSRNILLPEEIDVDGAEAQEKNGLLTIVLPKLDKNRKTKLQVKSR